MIAVWKLFVLLLWAQSPAWALHYSAPGQPVSSGGTLTGHQLLRIGEIHEHQRHFHEALTYYELALSAFREKKQAGGVAQALVKTAQVYERQGKLQDAYAALQEAVPILTGSSDRIARARALTLMGHVSARLGFPEEAEESLTRAVALFDRAKERHGWNEASVQLGLLKVGEGSAEQGLALLQRARREARDHRDAGQQLAAAQALGHAHRLLDRPREARVYYAEGLASAERGRNLKAEAALRLHLAGLESDAGLLEEAASSGTRALLLSRTLGDPEFEAAAAALLADLYRRMGRIEEAEEWTGRALSIYRSRRITVHGGR